MPPRKPAAREFAHDVVEVGLREPGGQALGRAEARDPAAGRALRVGHRGRLARRARRDIEAADDAARVGVEFLLGDARLLEVENVEEIVAVGFLERGDDRLGRPPAVGHAHRHQRGEAVGVQQHAVPRDDRPPVVPDDNGGLLPERVDQTDDVGREVLDVVVAHRRRLVGLAEAAHVRRDGVKAGGRQGRELVPPRVPGLRPAVQEQDERTLSLLRDPHLDAVGLDEPQPGYLQRRSCQRRDQRANGQWTYSV